MVRDQISINNSWIQYLAKKKHALIDVLDGTQEELDCLKVRSNGGFSRGNDVKSLKLSVTDLGYQEQVLDEL